MYTKVANSPSLLTSYMYLWMCVDGVGLSASASSTLSGYFQVKCNPMWYFTLSGYPVFLHKSYGFKTMVCRCTPTKYN